MSFFKYVSLLLQRYRSTQFYQTKENYMNRIKNRNMYNNKRNKGYAAT